MKRALACLGLAALLAGVPLGLLVLGGSPHMPSLSGLGGLQSSYMPIEPVLSVLALLAWGIWVYLAVAVALRAAAVLSASTQGRRSLLTASDRLAPRPLLRLVDLAIGGALLATSLSATRVTAWHTASMARAVTADIKYASAVVRVATDASPVAGPQASGSTYMVRPGDSLWRIAERELGAGARWREIFDLNSDRVFADGRSLHNPRLIHPGWELELPVAIEKAPVSAQTGEHASGPGTTLGKVPPLAAVSDPLPTPQQTPSPAATTPQHDSKITLVIPERRDLVVDRPAPGPALRLPSGLLVATCFGCAVLAAELIARLRRRRSRSPLSVAEEPEVAEPLVRDLRRAGAMPTATPIETAVDHVGEAWKAARSEWPRFLAAVESGRAVELLVGAGEGSLPKRSGGHLSPDVHFERSDDVVKAMLHGPFPVRLRRISTPLQRGLLVPLGQSGHKTVVHVGLLGIGTLSIEGSRTVDLLRQVILALAVESATDDLAMLLVGTEKLGLELDLPHVTKTCDWDDAPEALQEMQAEFVRRARLFEQEGADEIWSHLANHSDERLPAILIVATQPPPALRGVVEAVAGQAAQFGAALVAVGWEPQGSPLHVIAEGALCLRTSLPVPLRLRPFLLDEVSACEATRVIRSACAEEPDCPAEAPPIAQPPPPSWHPPEQRSLPTVEALPISRPFPQLALALVVEEPPSPPEMSAEEGQSAASPAPAALPHPRPAARALHEVDEGAVAANLPPRSETEIPAPPPDMPALYCLGPLQVACGGRLRPKGWWKKSRELLAYLVAHPEGASKDRIMEELWPEEDPQRVQNLFATAMSLIRRQVRTTKDFRKYILKVEDSWRLEEGAWWADAFEFSRLVSEAERVDDSVVSVVKLRRALTLYRGDFCDDVYYPWAEPVRERFRNLFIRACARLAEMLLDAGEHEEALEVLDRAIAADPICEDLWRRAMSAEASMGRRAAALDRYKKLKQILSTELDVEPDPETESLALQISSSELQAHRHHAVHGPESPLHPAAATVR